MVGLDRESPLLDLAVRLGSSSAVGYHQFLGLLAPHKDLLRDVKGGLAWIVFLSLCKNERDVRERGYKERKRLRR